MACGSPAMTAMAPPDPSSAAPAARPARRARVPSFEQRIVIGSLAVAAPASVLALLFALAPWPSASLRSALGLGAALLTAWLLRWHQRRLMYPVHTLSSLLEALRQGDYSLRGAAGGVLGDIVYDLNALADRLQRERLQFEESSYLLSKTLAALDNAVLVFDQALCLRLANPAAQRLLGSDRDRLFGRSAAELGLQALLDAPSGQLVTHAFASRSGRFEIRHAPLRTDGRSGRLLVVNDVGRVLREEERVAWQRLLRVLGHEVNNSLAPIQSMAGTLATLAMREPLPADWREDFRGGLELIGHRAGALSRFLASYSRLARLPPPRIRPLPLDALVAKAAKLETRVPVTVAYGPSLTIAGDADQLEQALINLVLNAAEASPPGGLVTVTWRVDAARVFIEVKDEGAGPPDSDNLFVPFFTTKPGGSGIGLALTRQIAEAHEGGASLLPRDGRPGAIATLWLPLPGERPLDVR